MKSIALFLSTMLLLVGVSLAGCKGRKDAKVQDDAQKTLAERLIGGTWTFTHTYEKQNGEWVMTDFNAPDENTLAFKEGGLVTLHLSKGDRSATTDCHWSIDNETGAFRMWIPDTEWEVAFTLSFVDDDTFDAVYTENTNLDTGEVTVGEYKDTYKRK